VRKFVCIDIPQLQRRKGRFESYFQLRIILRKLDGIGKEACTRDLDLAPIIFDPNTCILIKTGYSFAQPRWLK
jgi:hypothetical protein